MYTYRYIQIIGLTSFYNFKLVCSVLQVIGKLFKIGYGHILRMVRENFCSSLGEFFFYSQTVRPLVALLTRKKKESSSAGKI